MSNDKVIKLAQYENDTDEVLEHHVGNMHQVVILGYDMDGNYIAACDQTLTIEAIITMLERTKLHLLRELDTD